MIALIALTPATGFDPILITLLAQEPTNSGPDFGKASPIGLLVIVLLLIGVFALVRSMGRHLKRVPASFGVADAESGLGTSSGEPLSGERPSVDPPSVDPPSPGPVPGERTREPGR